MNRVLLMLPVLFSFLSGIGESCTTFCITEADRVIFAKNYDWNIGYGLILINKRGVAKKSASGQPENRASWVSRYGSLTFNQYGREFPSGGINEAGLAVELMWLDDAEYPADPRIPSVGTLEWIQYQLDQHATVKDVVASASRVRIASEVKLHYLVADRSGNTANIEFLNGKLVSHSGKTMPFRVLTNDPYERSLQFLKQHAGFGGELAFPGGTGSLQRFVRASSALQQFSKTDPISFAFKTLQEVGQPRQTNGASFTEVLSGDSVFSGRSGIGN